MAQAERVLQQEVTLRLRALGVLSFSVPNSLFFPARTEAERALIARVVSQMKNDGIITPGAPDLVIAGNGVVCFVELKTAGSRDLLGKTKRPGQLSDLQKEFRDRCADAGAPYYVCHSWDEVKAALMSERVLGPSTTPLFAERRV